MKGITPDPTSPGKRPRHLRSKGKINPEVMITADKGMTMMLLHAQDYLNNAQDLLAEKDTYRLITGNPTILKIKLNQIFGLLELKVDQMTLLMKPPSHNCSTP